jgi:hypothetical protein
MVFKVGNLISKVNLYMNLPSNNIKENKLPKPCIKENGEQK